MDNGLQASTATGMVFNEREQAIAAQRASTEALLPLTLFLCYSLRIITTATTIATI